MVVVYSDTQQIPCLFSCVEVARIAVIYNNNHYTTLGWFKGYYVSFAFYIQVTDDCNVLEDCFTTFISPGHQIGEVWVTRTHAHTQTDNVIYMTYSILCSPTLYSPRLMRKQLILSRADLQGNRRSEKNGQRNFIIVYTIIIVQSMRRHICQHMRCRPAGHAHICPVVQFCACAPAPPSISGTGGYYIGYLYVRAVQ